MSTTAEILDAKTVDRFWSFVLRGSGCWVWTGARHSLRTPYGQFWWKGRIWRAHRIAWMLAHGPIPPELLVCHHCDNHPCVNPDHLFLGTVRDNTVDSFRKKRSRGKTGTTNGRAKLSENDVRQIRNLSGSGIGRVELAKRFGISKFHVSKIVRRESWQGVA